MNLIKPCRQYLAFDDRKLMLIGMPILALLMPILLNFSDQHGSKAYWFSQVPESLVFVAGFWLTYRTLMIAMHRRFPDYKQARIRIFLQILLILVSAPLLKAIFSFAATEFLKICNVADYNMPGHAQGLVGIYLPSFLIMATYEAIYYFVQYRKAIIDRERLETQHVETKLSNLRNQINPHFLFNSLNTLMNLIPTDQEGAMNYLSKLSKFYRYAVSANEEKLIPLAKEIEFANLYIDLLHERFKDALDVRINVQDHYHQMIPPLSLQLLIENAVKHNVVSRDNPLKIEIVFDADEGELVISNNIQRKLDSVTSTGMGLENIKKRFRYFTMRPVRITNDMKRFQVALPTITT